MQNKEYIEEEIDLRELFQIIWNRKIFIVIFTLVITILSVIYVSFKNPIPVYQGKTFLEIGEIQSQTFGGKPLDTPANLATILKLEFDVNASIPKGTNNLLEISSDSIDKEIIKINLKKSIEFIMNRHKEKLKFYENIIMSKQIGNIVVSNEPINTPKKKLTIVVAFVTGFILSIFLVFFMSFISNLKKEDDKS